MDRSRQKKLAQDMLDVLTRRGRPGGIDVDRLDGDNAMALQWLLKHNPHLTVVKNKTRLTLMFKDDVHKTFGGGAVEVFERYGIAANPGEDL